MAKSGKDHVIEMKKSKECKGSVRYDTQDPKAAVQNVYVSREAFETMPDAVEVTVKAK